MRLINPQSSNGHVGMENKQMKTPEDEKPKGVWSRYGGWIFWGSLPVTMVAGAVYAITKSDDPDMFCLGFFKIGPCFWLIIWLLVLLVYLLIITITDDSDHDSNSSGGSSCSSGVEWGRFANWYLRGMVRRQMRNMWK